jgi:hypothetical protein
MIDYIAKTGANYRFFSVAPLVEGSAKTEDTEDAVGPVLFFAAAFLGFLYSRFDFF